MKRKAYPSDVSDDEWAFVAPYLTLMIEEAPQRAWQRREILSQKPQELLEGFPPAQRALGGELLQAWNLAVRASSAMENWHCFVRPHLSVHRTLSAEMLALLAIWHNHRVAPRGLLAGLSPFQLSGFDQPETDWLLTLGYLPRIA